MMIKLANRPGFPHDSLWRLWPVSAPDSAPSGICDYTDFYYDAWRVIEEREALDDTAFYGSERYIETHTTFINGYSIDYSGYLYRRVNEHMYDPDLPDDVRNFFWESLSDKRLAKLVRNNIAEALKNQEVKNPGLYKTFIDAIDDDGEELDWRLYAIQHLGNRSGGGLSILLT